MSALAGIDIALWDLKGKHILSVERRAADLSGKARKLNVPIYQLLGGKLRSKLKVYAWIGGDRPADVEVQAYVPFVNHFRVQCWHLRLRNMRFVSLRPCCTDGRSSTAVHRTGSKKAL